MRTARSILLLYAATAGATAVIAGAFGAHALGSSLPAERLDIFQTAVKYQAWHAIVLLALASLANGMEQKRILLAGRFFLSGILLFSGSLYFLSCRNLFGAEEFTIAGIITPFGGACFIVGWIILFVAGWRERNI